jgi:hypothetical protein
MGGALYAQPLVFAFADATLGLNALIHDNTAQACGQTLQGCKQLC